MNPARTADSHAAHIPLSDPQTHTHPVWHLRLIALLVFLLLLLTTFILVIQYESRWRKEQELLLTTIATSQATVLERRLNNSLVSAYILGQQVRYENGQLADFPTFADNLIRYLGGITNLQLAPGGIITDIFPVDDRHQRALGLDIFANEHSREHARQARDSQELIIAGPFQLQQGGVAVSGRYPVYLGEGKDARFWGIASALITMEDFLGDTSLATLTEQGYRHQLWRHRSDGEREVMSGYQEGELPGLVVSRALSLPGETWHLDVGFLNPTSAPGRHLALGTGIVASSIGSFLLFQLLLVPQRLRAEVHRKTAQLENLAYYDPLTDLANRKFFMEQLDQATHSGKRSGRGFALMFIDLDGFKHINDTLGHAEGDNLLKGIAHNLRTALRESDIVARLGGDEFTVLSLDTTNEFQALAVAEKLLGALSTPVTLSHQKITASGSIGITLFPNDGTSSSELMQNADLAMYKAKAEGRNNYQFFSADLQKQAQKRLQIEAELRHAIDAGHFHLEYQPVVCLNTGSVLSVEALLRWRHPERGLIPPSEFIPIAEDSGLITALGSWVIRQACLEMHSLNQTRDRGNALELAINLSPLQLHHRNLLQTVEDTLQELQLSGEHLTFEVTESTLMDRLDESLLVLNKIRRLGSRVAIDDFGTGYSSLSMLKLLPVNSVKIDRSFVRDIGVDGDDREIVAAIISIGHRLGLKVVAEGVETREQLQFLCAHRCDTAQGFLFSRPLPIDQLAAAIADLEPRLPALLTELHRVRAARV